MLVTADQTVATIGGGHLEWLAIEHARSMLRGKLAESEQRYPLGASSGQCCGGEMTLRYAWLNASHVAQLVAQQAHWKTLLLFGAGHVARALVGYLAALPLQVVWVDSRDSINSTHNSTRSTHGESDVFPAHLPANVSTVLSDTPEAELALAPAGSLVLVMTHSHALDEQLIDAALARGGWGYLGLIGSATKRRRFEQRWVARGLTANAYDQLTCPIGDTSNESAYRQNPEVLALGVAAQIATYL